MLTNSASRKLWQEEYSPPIDSIKPQEYLPPGRDLPTWKAVNQLRT